MSDSYMGFTFLYIGMFGGQLKDAVNGNFNILDTKMDNIDTALNVRIVSNQIKEIKEDSGVVSYTLDGEHWTSLTPAWGTIVGQISNQTDLIEFLSANYASLPQFNDLSSNVTSIDLLLDTTVETLGSVVSDVTTIKSQLNDSTTGLIVRVNNLETLVATAVQSSNIRAIRYSSGSGEMQYSADGVSWTSMKTITNWGEIQGDIQNQSDLYLLLNNLQTSFTNLDNIVNKSSMQNLTESEYEALNSTESNQLYNLTDADF